MKQGHIDLYDSITNMYQILPYRKPNQYVYLYNRFYGKKDDEFLVKKGRLPGVISLSTNWTTDTTAGSFSIVLENNEGMFTPEYSYGKVPLDQAFRGHLFSPWRGQLVPNNKIEIWMGYGHDLVKEMTGLIDDIVVNAEEQTVTVTGRSMYKRAIDNTCRPTPGHQHTLPFDTMRITDGVGRLMNYAGLQFKGKPIIDEATNENFIVGQPMGEKGETYDEVASRLINSVFHHLREDPDGVIHQIEIPVFSEEMKADFVIDEERHLSSLEYKIDDTSLYGTVHIVSNKIKNTYSSHYITNDILLGERREVVIDYPWANSEYKRKLAAQSEFTRMLYRAQTINVSLPANPLLQVYDVVRVLEKTSLARWNYHIRSINNEFDASGYTQTLELSINKGFEKSKPVPPQTHLPKVTTNKDKLTLGVWDGGAYDLDVISIRLNGEVITASHILKETADTFNLDLKKGNNIIEFVGISAGRSGGITIGAYLEDEDEELLTPEGATIVMPRGQTDAYGFIQSPKPVRKWVITRE